MTGGADEDARARALALLKCHGWDATSFQTLEPGFQYWFDGAEACVAYVDTGRAWVAAGAPITTHARIAATATRFAVAARAAGRRAAFFATDGRFVASTPALRALAIGEQPEWDPATWSRTMARATSLRAQLRRASSKDVTVRQVPPLELDDRNHATRRRVERLIARWLAGHALPPLGFLVEVHAFLHLEERLCFVAERAGRVVGFLAAVPVYARKGWLFENLVRDPTAPNGTTELLFDAAMRTVAAAGSGYVTLGLAPLVGAVRWWLRLARQARGLYDFQGLAAFKAKLRPTVRSPMFLSYPREHGAPRIVLDTLTAFARGDVLAFGANALLRRRSERGDDSAERDRQLLASGAHATQVFGTIAEAWRR
jgi:lysylphosphatidylglycerol synthetase-like protein (DUF2156 family)